MSVARREDDVFAGIGPCRELHCGPLHQFSAKAGLGLDDSGEAAIVAPRAHWEGAPVPVCPDCGYDAAACANDDVDEQHLGCCEGDYFSDDVGDYKPCAGVAPVADHISVFEVDPHSWRDGCVSFGGCAEGAAPCADAEVDFGAAPVSSECD